MLPGQSHLFGLDADASPTPRPVQMRWAIRSDRLAILDIERTSFPYPWGEDRLAAELRRRNVIAQVVYDGDELVGFVVYEMRPRSVDVLALAVASHRRREGIGRFLLGRIVDKLHPLRRRVATLRVRESNLGAQLWFRRLGWRASGVVRGHFDDTGEDAYPFQWALPIGGDHADPT